MIIFPIGRLSFWTSFFPCFFVLPHNRPGFLHREIHCRGPEIKQNPDYRYARTAGNDVVFQFILLRSYFYLLIPDFRESFVVEKDKELYYTAWDIYSINIYFVTSVCQALSQCWGYRSARGSRRLWPPGTHSPANGEHLMASGALKVKEMGLSLDCEASPWPSSRNHTGNLICRVATVNCPNWKSRMKWTTENLKAKPGIKR